MPQGEAVGCGLLAGIGDRGVAAGSVTKGAGREGEAEGGRPTVVGSRTPKKGMEVEMERGVVVGGAAEGRAERRGGGAECVVVLGEDVEFDGLIDEWQISSTEQIAHREKETTISKHQISYLLLPPIRSNRHFALLLWYGLLVQRAAPGVQPRRTKSKWKGTRRTKSKWKGREGNKEESRRAAEPKTGKIIQ
ncbi:unnamed protein product [Calypogeia fissa]